ncbi:S-adenosylmethionine decarboxylase [Patescibacteria group bacterium]|nr:S-adenosylmethionine decarboxylase [Patescibacteria group bacterium]
MTHYQSPATGNEISAVFHGVPPEVLNNIELIDATLHEGLKIDNFTVLGSLPHRFTPLGYTTLVLLAESHAAIHTYPEHNSIYFSLYSCRGEEDGSGAFEHFRASIPHESVTIINNKITVKLNDA